MLRSSSDTPNPILKAICARAKTAVGYTGDNEKQKETQEDYTHQDVYIIYIDLFIYFFYFIYFLRFEPTRSCNYNS